MKGHHFFITSMIALLMIGWIVPTAYACPRYVGDYVWYDRNGNGLQDEDAAAGFNEVRVNVFRDYGCDGMIDPEDEITNYAITSDDSAGNPGYYMVEVPGSCDCQEDWCYVAFVDESTLPSPDLFPTTDSEHSFVISCEDYLDADFGFTDEVVECGECEGKVSELSLLYNGSDEAFVEVKQKKDHVVVFSGNVAPGEVFSFVGQDKKGTLGTEIEIYVNGSLAEKIHTSCSQPIGPGLIAGDFAVVAGASKEGGALCPVEPEPEMCECDGKVNQLSLLYNGADEALVEVKQKKDHVVVFSGNVAPGEVFSFVGMDKKGTLGTEIEIYVYGDLHVKIHTSCSQPIGPGLIAGDFEVVAGSSRNGGALCPLP